MAEIDAESAQRRALTALAAEFPVSVAQKTSYVLPFGRPVFGLAEAVSLLQALRDGDLATGNLIAKFESAFCEKFGFPHAIAVSSGSVANTLAIETLIASKRLSRGDGVVVSGATFLTAVSPVVQAGCVPIFIDLAKDDLNYDLDALDRACREHMPKAAILPHTLGQAVDLDRLRSIASAHHLALIEDCCESLATSRNGKNVGSVGDLATFSFYAGHHITTAEGGMLISNDRSLAATARSLRVFGRDLEYSGKRFDYPVDDRPISPDERYIYGLMGFNAKMTDLQAALGLVQLKRLDYIMSSRRTSAALVVDVLRGAGVRVLGDPLAKGAQPFGVVIIVPDGVNQLAAATAFDKAGVEVRSLLGASVPHQPAFDGVRHVIVEPYVNAQVAGRRALILGCPPDLDLDRARAALENALGSLRA